MNRIVCALLGPVAAVILPSCYDAGLLYPSGGYSGGNYGSYGPSTTVYRPVGGFGNSGWGGGGYGGYGYGGYGYGGYGGNRSCSRCGYNPCRCSGGANSHNHSSHSTSSSNRNNSSDRQYRIIAGDLNGKKKPTDFHTLDWYHDRGYSLEKVKMETDRGAVIDKRSGSQKSSSHKSSSNSHSHSSSSHTRASSTKKK